MGTIRGTGTGASVQEEMKILELINARGHFDNPLPLCHITGAGARFHDI